MKIKYAVVLKSSAKNYNVYCDDFFTLKQARIVAKAWKKKSPEAQTEIWRNKTTTKKIEVYR